MHITIGADPELFLQDIKNDHFVSAAGFFPGTKKEPYKVDCGAVQVDGIALEFNIVPADNVKDFEDNIRAVMSQMDKMVHEVNPNWKLRNTPYVKIAKEDWEPVPADAKELGCDPDYNYMGSINQNPTERVERQAKIENVGAVRTGSGHIHIGWSEGENPHDPLHFEDCRACAYFFYANNVFTLPRNNTEQNLEYSRSMLYGHAGAFRPKPYGVELRSPSNLWLRDSETIKSIFNRTKTHFDMFASQGS